MLNSPHVGEVTLQQHALGISVVHMRYPPGLRLADHAHDSACFAWVQSGAQVETFGNRPFQLHARQVLFRPAGESHRDHFLSVETSCVIIEVSDNWLKLVDNFGRIPSEPFISTSPQTSRLAADLYVQAQQKDAAVGLAIEGLSYALAAEFLRASMREEGDYPPRWLRKLYEQLAENPCGRFSLADLATSTGVHPVHLSRQFKRYYGEPLWEFLRRRRIEIGAQRILSEQATLCEIAHGLGFPDQAQFTRTFKRFMGVRPSDFRRDNAVGGVEGSLKMALMNRKKLHERQET